MKQNNDATSYDATLHELAGRIGARAAERLDVEATAQAVVARLRAEPVRRHWWIQPAWLRVAAAVVLLVGAGLLTRSVVRAPHGGPGHYVAEDLTDLSADELQQLLGSLDQTLDLNVPQVPDAGLEEMDAQQLQTVLRSLEG